MPTSSVNKHEEFIPANFVSERRRTERNNLEFTSKEEEEHNMMRRAARSSGEYHSDE